MFALQFSLMFMGISMGMTQAAFTMLFAFLVFKEKLSQWQIIGAFVSFSGIGIVGINIGESVGLAGFLLVLSAAVGWGIGSVLVKKMGPVNHFGLIVWASLIAWPPLLAFSLLVETPDSTIHQLAYISQSTILSILYTTLVSTCFGFVAWNWLIAKYPITLVAPFTLLVPIFGMSGSAFWLGEPIYIWKIASAFLVISGILLHQIGPRIAEIKKIFLRKKEFD